MKKQEAKAYKINYVRQHNIRLIMSLLYSSPMSCLEISKVIGISDVGVRNIVKFLQSNNILIVAKNVEKQKQQGNQHIRYRVNPDLGIFVVFDFTQYHDELCIFDFSAKLVYKEHYNLTLNKISFDELSKLVSHIKDVIEKLDLKEKRILSTSLAVTGQYDEVLKNFTISHRFEEFVNDSNQRFYNLFHKELNSPVIIKNNVAFMALGEVEKRKISTEVPVLYMFLDFGIASSIIHNDEILSGWHGYAGEIGGTFMGEKGTLSTQSALVHLEERCAKFIEEGKEPAVAIKEACKNNQFVQQQIKEAGEAIGIATSNFCNLIGIKTVFIGGTLLNIDDSIKDDIEKILKRRVIAPVEMDISTDPEITVFGALSKAKDVAINRLLEETAENTNKII